MKTEHAIRTNQTFGSTRIDFSTFHFSHENLLTPFVSHHSTSTTQLRDQNFQYRIDTAFNGIDADSDGEENVSDIDSCELVLDHEENKIPVTVGAEKVWDVIVSFLHAQTAVDFELIREEWKIQGYVYSGVYFVAYSIEIYAPPELFKQGHVIFERLSGNAFTLTDFINSLRDEFDGKGILPTNAFSTGDPHAADSDDELLTPETLDSEVLDWSTAAYFDPSFDPSLVGCYVSEIRDLGASLDRARHCFCQLAHFSSLPDFKPYITAATDELIPPLMNFLQTSSDLILDRSCVVILLCILSTQSKALEFCQLGYLSVLCDVLQRWSGMKRKAPDPSADEWLHDRKENVPHVHSIISHSRTVCFVISQCYLIILQSLGRDHYTLFTNVNGRLRNLLVDANFEQSISCNLKEVVTRCMKSSDVL